MVSKREHQQRKGGRRILAAAACVVAGLSTVGVMAASSRAGATPRTLPTGPLYGVTVDDISNISQVVAANSALPEMPTTRVYLDPTEPASYYTSAVAALDQHSYVMGEILDSSDMKSQTVTGEQQRVSSLLSTLGSGVDVWEVGNEVNGNWTGPYSTGAQMVSNTYNQVVAAGGRTALTLYYNIGCGDGASELDPISYSNQYLPAAVRDGLNYVLLSYYQTQCNNQVLSASTVTTYMQQLHTVFPNSLLGFGEVGLPNPVTSSTLTTAESIIQHYYTLPINLPYYIGGYFYWYYDEDAIPYLGNPIWQSIGTAMQGEAAVLPPGPTAPGATTTTVPSVSGSSPTSGSPAPFSSMAAGTWAQGSSYGGWNELWTGYGSVGITADPVSGQNSLYLSPQASTSASETHAALVVSQSSYASPSFTVAVRTVAQLRQNSAPNPWEVGWVLWDYNPDDSFYALVLKPNGWELDKEVQGVQHFLATGSSPTFPPGNWYNVMVTESGGKISVSVDGQHLVTQRDNSFQAGAIGLYCEDSNVHFGDVSVQASTLLGAARSVKVKK